MRIQNFLSLAFLLTGFSLVASSTEAALVAHWPLKDGANGTPVTTADDVIDDPTHPATNATKTGTGGTWFNDPSRGIVYSTGEDDRLSAGTQGIDRSVGFTWHAWVNAAFSNIADTGADVLLGTRAASGGNWHKLQTGGVSNWASFGGYELADDTWHHIAYVGDTTSIRLYIDGVPSGSVASTATATFNGNFEIGGSSTFGEDSTALMSDVAIWEEALTVDEIISLADLTDSAGLLYDAGQFDLLKQAHDAGSGSVVIDDLTWEYATGLTGPAGLTGAGGSYALVMDAGAGTGFRVFAPIPEPSSMLLTALGLVGLMKLRRRRAG